MSPKASTRLLATQSDERLAAMARAGHDRAFEALVQRYRRPLLRYCRRMSISDSRAEDVVQQTLLQAWSALRRGAAVRALRPWLYRIAHNTVVNLARDSARDGSGLALDLDGVSGAEPAVVLEPDLADGLHLRDALTDMAALPHMQREVIFRTALAGYSHEEVANALGITDGAVRGLLYRARATLRAAITAVTPPPLIAWISGPGQGVLAEHVGELAAGGGLGAGLLAKGALAVLAAGTLITGAAIVHSNPSAHIHARAAPPSAGREIATLAAPGSAPARPAAPTTNATRAGSVSPASTSPRSAGRRPVRLRIATPDPNGSAHAPSVSPAHPLPPTPKGTAPTSTTVHVPVSSGTPPSSGSGGGGPGAGGGGSSGPTGGSGGGGSTGGGGSGSGGSGSGGGGSGSGGSGSGSGGSPGGGSGGSESESPPPPSGGSGAGPVTTIVTEVTGLLEHTVHGVLGHNARLNTPSSTSALYAGRARYEGLLLPPSQTATAASHRLADPASELPHHAANPACACVMGPGSTSPTHGHAVDAQHRHADPASDPRRKATNTGPLGGPS